MKGKFIAIEGPDGSGKSTIINKLKEYFIANDSNIKFTREPGGTRISEKIRDILLDASNKEMTDYTEAYLYAASRLQHVEEFILPNMEDGYHVISDRFSMASVAYQGYGREKNVGLIESINKLAVDMIGEVHYIVLMLTPSEGLVRKKGQKVLDRLESENIDFHNRVYNGYNKLIEKNSAIRVDASQSIDDTFKEVLDALKQVGIEV